MAEALGAAVLTVSVDDTQLRAGLLAVQSEAQRTAAIVQQAFAQAAQAQRQPPAAPRPAAPPLPPPIPPELLQRIEGTGVASSTAAAGVRQLVAALAAVGAGAAALGFIKGSISAAVELESIARKLSNTLGPQGAGGALAFTRGLSDQLGLSFKTLAGAFGSFTAAATAANVPIETQKNLFAAVSRAGQALGLSNYEIQGSLLALQQVAAKGTVQMEELRGQLGERLPIALSATARGLGISQRELIKLVETGKLTADRFFPALTKGLNELTSGSGGIPTAAQNFQKLANAWDDLQTTFGESLLPTVTQQVKNLADALQGLKVGIDANKLGLGGVLGNLGLVPQEAAGAVGQLRGLAKAYNLSDKEARALFYDAAKLSGMKLGPTGFLPDAKALDATLARLPDLAQQFRQRNPDQQAAKNARDARAAAEAQKALQEAEARQARNRIDTANAVRDLEIQGINSRADAAKQLANLDGVELTRLQNKLAIQDKILERRRLEVQLADELTKPVGAGDGKNGTQSRARIADLQGSINKAGAEIRAAYIDAGIALEKSAREAAAITAERLRKDREFIDRIQGIQRERAIARSGLNSPIDVVDPGSAAQEGRRRVAASVASELQPVIQARQEFAMLSEAALEAERKAAQEKTEAARSAATDAAQAAAEAGEKLGLAGDRFGQSLRDGAREAAQQLRNAQSGFNDVIRGNPGVFSQALVNEQLRLARAEFQPLVDRGVIRSGIPVQTPEQIFGLAGIARQFTNAENQVILARNQKLAADRLFENNSLLAENIPLLAQNVTQLQQLGLSVNRLADKDWTVNVTVFPNP